MNNIETVYHIATNGKLRYGETKGVCRIMGKEAVGVPFDKWVKKTFTDFPFLQEGDIISNEALFTFEEGSEIIQQKVGSERPQRFRTYSHIISGQRWYALTKADKELMWDIITTQNPQCVCIAESGQKHIFFKIREGWWQFEEKQILPNLKLLKQINSIMNELYAGGFTQEEIKSGKYQDQRIIKFGLAEWKALDERLKPFRNSNIFDFAAFFMLKKEDEGIKPIIKNDNQPPIVTVPDKKEVGQLTFGF
jgi:hypothetical protein